MLRARCPQGPQALGSNRASRLWTYGQRAGCLICFERSRAWLPPGSIALEHGVEDHDDLAHHCHQRDFSELAAGAQPFMKLFEHRIAADRTQRAHVKLAADRIASAPDDPAAAPAAAVIGERGDSDQSCGGFAAERAQFRQLGQHRGAEHLAHPRKAAQHLALAPPGLRAPHGLIDIIVDLCDAALQVSDMLAQLFTDLRGSSPTTILRFRHLLERHGLTRGIFEEIEGLLEQRRLLLRSGTIVDATIIAAPSSTKNASASRDPEMKQTRKGRNWFFGMKLHIGTDRRGIVHTVRATDAGVSDITQLPDLLHGQEREVFGDQAYWKEDDRRFLEAWGMRYRINRRPTSKRPLSERWRMINRARSRTRARGEHAFRVVKQLWGFAKVRYRGLAKNLARAQTMFALANLYQVRRQLLPTEAKCAR